MSASPRTKLFPSNPAENLSNYALRGFQPSRTYKVYHRATMASISSPMWPAPTPIAQLQPIAEPETRSISGIVTLIWPYSASLSSYSFLLVEPDFRLRRRHGQVRLHFHGSSAKAVARAGIKGGDKVLLSLQDVQWAKGVSDEITEQTPGRSIEWELRFEKRLILQVRKASFVDSE